jgi:hypothetical protein
MGNRGREPGNIKQSGIGARGPFIEDWVRVDVTDGTWQTNDPDSCASNISNTDGINYADLDGTSNNKYIDGRVWYKELYTEDGTSFDFADRPVDFRAYVHMPECGWDSSGSETGTNTLDNPPEGSRTYCIIGIVSDPENLPTSGATPVPKNILGCGLEWQTNTNRLFRTAIRNTSNAMPNGVLDTNKSGLDAISDTDVAAGHKACNRLEWSTYISKAEQLGSGNLDVAGSPRSYYLVWIPRYDNGDKYMVGNFAAQQRWGRGGDDMSKLYVFVAVGRGSAGGSAQTLAFDCYYEARLLEGGNNPPGKDSLPD